MPKIPPAATGVALALIVEAHGYLRKGEGTHIIFDDHLSFELCASRLLSAVPLSKALSAEERGSLVERALLDTFRAGTATVKALEIQLKKHQSDLQKPSARQYHMLAYVGGKVNPTGARIIFSAPTGAATVRFVRTYPSRANTAPWLLSGFGPINLAPEVAQAPLWVTVEARTESQAWENALSAVSALLGCVNYCLNYGRQRIMSGRPIPRNSVRLMGVQVLYRYDWSRVENSAGFEENPYEETFPVEIDASIYKLRKPLRRMVKGMSGNVLGPLLFEAMQDYQEGLSHADDSLVHLRLWSLLERLTDTPKGDSTVTIRRGSFLAREMEAKRQRLKHAADTRNAFVHRRERTPFINAISHDLRFRVEAMLRFLFFAQHRFMYLDEFFQLLDSPRTASEIARKVRMLRHARTLIEP